MENIKYYNYQNIADESTNKIDKFKNSLKYFENIKTVVEARNLAKEIFQVENEINYLNFDNAQCVIVQSANVFRICLESDTEFICYNITKNNENK